MRDLDKIPVKEWTEFEALWHLRETFQAATRRHPDLMESYVIMMGETQNPEELTAVMRAGLAATVKARYPVH